MLKETTEPEIPFLAKNAKKAEEEEAALVAAIKAKKAEEEEAALVAAKKAKKAEEEEAALVAAKKAKKAEEEEAALVAAIKAEDEEPARNQAARITTEEEAARIVAEKETTSKKRNKCHIPELARRREEKNSQPVRAARRSRPSAVPIEVDANDTIRDREKRVERIQRGEILENTRDLNIRLAMGFGKPDRTGDGIEEEMKAKADGSEGTKKRKEKPLTGDGIDQLRKRPRTMSTNGTHSGHTRDCPDIGGSTTDDEEMQQAANLQLRQGDHPDTGGSTTDDEEMQQAANLQLLQGNHLDIGSSNSVFREITIEKKESVGKGINNREGVLGARNKNASRMEWRGGPRVPRMVGELSTAVDVHWATKRKASIDAVSPRGETQQVKKRRVTASISGKKYHERALVTNSQSQSDVTMEGTGSQANLELSSLGIRAARVANSYTSDQLYREFDENNKTKDKTKIAADKGSVWNVDTVDRTKLANTVDRAKLDNTDKPWWYYSIKWEEAVKAKVQILFKVYKQNRWEDWGCPAAITSEKSVTNIANTAEKKAKEDGARLYNVELTWLTREDYLQGLLSTNTDVILIIRAEDLETEGIQESIKHLKEE
ncbi:hypothetical protein VE03_10619, partial [Pseudogymnoascus sp. 23342-1-I1]